MIRRLSPLFLIPAFVRGEEAAAAGKSCTDFATVEECLGEEVIGCEWIQEIAERSPDNPACHASGDDWCYLFKGKNGCKSISKCDYDSRTKKCELIPDDGCGGLVKGECELHSNCAYTTECVSLKNNKCAAGWGKRKSCTDIPGCQYSNKECTVSADDPLNKECMDIEEKKACKSNDRCEYVQNQCVGPMKDRQCTYNQLILQLPFYTLAITGAVGMEQTEVIGYDQADATCLCFEHCMAAEGMMYWNVEFENDYKGTCSCYTDSYEDFRVRKSKKAMVCGGMTFDAHAAVEEAAP